MRRYIYAVLGLLKNIYLRLKFSNEAKFSIRNVEMREIKFIKDKKACLTIGKNFTGRTGAILYIRAGGDLKIGDNCFINSYSSINCHKSINIGDNTIIGQNVLIYDLSKNFTINAFRTI